MTIDQHIWTNVDKTKYFSFRQVQLVSSRHTLFIVVIKRRYGLLEALRQLAIFFLFRCPYYVTKNENDFEKLLG